MHRQRFLCEQGYEYAIVDAEARHAAAGARKPAAVRLRHVDWNGVLRRRPPARRSLDRELRRYWCATRCARLRLPPVTDGAG